MFLTKINVILLSNHLCIGIQQESCRIFAENIRVFDENLSAEIYRDVPEMTDRRFPKIIHVVVSKNKMDVPKDFGVIDYYWLINV